MAAAGPGDIVYIESGTYVENLVLTRSGSSGNPIIFSCAPGDLGQPRRAEVGGHAGADPQQDLFLIDEFDVFIGEIETGFDIGELMTPPGVVPVVIKSLLFS